MKITSRIFLVLFALLALNGCGGSGAAGGTDKPITSAPSCDVTAPGKVINENPLTESPGLSFSASLAALGTAATITGLDGSCLLRNSYFKVTSDTAFPSTIANVRAGLVFTPDDPRFQQVSTFYHAHRVRMLVSSAGGDLSGLSSLSLDAHCNVTDNAYYSPSSNFVCLGYTMSGAKKLYASDDADVIMHEFGHAINHKMASTSIMNSSSESGAIDEAMADYWALTTIGNATLSEWFLGLFDATDGLPDPYSVRIATLNHSYPADLEGEIHRDARPWTQVMWTIRQGIGSTKADSLAVRMVDLLPATARYSDAVTALQSAATSLGFTVGEIATINTALTNKGLLRTDSAAGLALSTVVGHQSVYIIDDHTYSAQVGGNCNGALDVGETALVMINPQSPIGGALLGLGVGSLASAGGSVGSIAFATGGNVAEYIRMNGTGADFVDVLDDANIFDSDDTTAWASFLIRGVTAGVVNQKFTFQPMGGVAVTIPVSFTVGSVATRATTCPLGVNNRLLWPIP